MAQTVKIKIDSMAFKGYGVARVDGKVVFIPYLVTGDEAWAEIIEEKKTYSMGRLIEIHKRSPWRVNPPCSYFGVCGGCQWQHIDYSKQVELKKEILREILKRLGGMKEIPSISVESSPDPYDYRTRIQLKIKGGALGYYKERSHQLVNIDHCPIAHPLVNQVISGIQKALPSLSAFEEIEINASPEEGKGILTLHLLPFHQVTEVSLKDFLQTHSILKGIAIKSKNRFTLFGDPCLYFTISLNPFIENRLLRLRVTSGSFYQVHLKQNERLIQRVLEFSETKENEKVIDLYSGIGNFTLPLSILSREVQGAEENWTAVRDGQFNAEQNGITNCTFIHGKAEDFLKRWKRKKPDLVVLDPPRMGGKMILDQIISWKPKKIVYVSCEPTILARDLRFFLKGGYSLHRLALVDMFPQTYHMEVLGLLTNPQVKV